MTVDNAGNARAVGLGSATITARYDSKSTSTTFTVAIDTDGDTVPDPMNNCTLVPNPGQCDSDSDGFGNHCDGDLNNNDFTNAQDTTLFRDPARDCPAMRRSSTRRTSIATAS